MKDSFTFLGEKDTFLTVGVPELSACIYSDLLQNVT